MSQNEYIDLLKKGESAFYGIFHRYFWRDDKSGKSFFQIRTKQPLFLKQQYQKMEKLRDQINKTDITWYYINCDASKTNTTYYEEKTPVKITGYFVTEGSSEYCWDFHVTSMQEASVDETTTIEYLSSIGISYEEAVKVVSFHGSDIFTFVERADAAKLIQQETGMDAETVSSMILTIRNTIEERKLYSFLGPLGIPYPYAAKLIKYYGENAEKILKKDPHYTGFKVGLNFKQCDLIAKACGCCYDYGGRVRQAIYEVLNMLGSDGHVWTTQDDFYYSLYRTLKSSCYEEFRPTFLDFFPMVMDILGTNEINGSEIFYNKKLYQAETRIAKNLIRLSSMTDKKNQGWNPRLIEYAQNACQINYGEQQRRAFSTVLSSKGLKVVIGGPGTGKTTTIKGIILAYKKIFPDNKVKLCAPTGRAAQRMAESTGMEATTVQRLLDYRPYGDSSIHKDANDPIMADLIVVDEMSMMNIELFDIFLSAIKTGTTIIFVGDTHQLEAVGAGSILKDLLEMPETITQKCELTDVFRQKGGSPIIENSMRINRGETTLETRDDFQILHTKSEEESRDKVLEIMKGLYNPDDPFETQILCPSRKGEAGITNLNTLLQQEFNPGKKGLQYGSTKFRVGDKIMMTNNNYDSTCLFYNGDIGVIKEIHPNGMDVEIRGEILRIKRQMLNLVQLSYGMTIHKSQGSEFKNVVIVMPMEPKSMLVRNLLYTAVTRAKKRVIIINEGSALETSIKVDKSQSRRTTLLLQLRQMLEEKRN